MNAQTKMSGKGQVVIPKDVRDRLQLRAGDRLEIVERSDGLLLRKSYPKSGETFDALTERLRTQIRYDGPPVSIADMNEAIHDAAIDHAVRRDDRARG